MIFLWDIDGTILLAGGAGMRSFNRVFEDLYGEKNIWQDIHPDGRTDPSLIEEMYQKRFSRLPTPAEYQKIQDVYHVYLEDDLNQSPGFRLMPHVEDVLGQLKKNPDINLGLATGNFRIAAELKLKRAGFDGFFDFGGFGCDSQDRLTLTSLALQRGHDFTGKKDSPIFLIGDSIHDVNCGNAIGATTIAVCTGGTKRDALEKAKATHVIDDLSEFWRII